MTDEQLEQAVRDCVQPLARRADNKAQRLALLDEASGKIRTILRAFRAENESLKHKLVEMEFLVKRAYGDAVK